MDFQNSENDADISSSLLYRVRRVRRACRVASQSSLYITCWIFDAAFVLCVDVFHIGIEVMDLLVWGLLTLARPKALVAPIALWLAIGLGPILICGRRFRLGPTISGGRLWRRFRPAQKGGAEFLHRHVLAGSRRCGGCRGRCGPVRALVGPCAPCLQASPQGGATSQASATAEARPHGTAS